MFSNVKPGDIVHYSTPQGQYGKGKAVLTYDTHVVVSRKGQPQVVNDKNYVKHERGGKVIGALLSKVAAHDKYMKTTAAIKAGNKLSPYKLGEPQDNASKAFGWTKTNEAHDNEDDGPDVNDDRGGGGGGKPSKEQKEALRKIREYDAKQKAAKATDAKRRAIKKAARNYGDARRVAQSLKKLAEGRNSDADADEVEKLRIPPKSMRSKAMRQSMKHGGVAQHINRQPHGGHAIEDWYDSDNTVVTYVNGKLKEGWNKKIGSKMGGKSDLAKNITSKESLSRKYDKNEDENRHSENAVLLAKHFGTPEELERMNHMLKTRNKLGHLHNDHTGYAYEMAKKYYHKLKEAYNTDPDVGRKKDFFKTKYVNAGRKTTKVTDAGRKTTKVTTADRIAAQRKADRLEEYNTDPDVGRKREGKLLKDFIKTKYVNAGRKTTKAAAQKAWAAGKTTKVTTADRIAAQRKAVRLEGEASELGIYHGSRVSKKGLLGTKYGSATPFNNKGHVSVKWDSGKESIHHESELKALRSVDKGYWDNKKKKSVKEMRNPSGPYGGHPYDWDPTLRKQIMTAAAKKVKKLPGSPQPSKFETDRVYKPTYNPPPRRGTANEALLATIKSKLGMKPGRSTGMPATGRPGRAVKKQPMGGYHAKNSKGEDRHFADKEAAGKWMRSEAAKWRSTSVAKPSPDFDPLEDPKRSSRERFGKLRATSDNGLDRLTFRGRGNRGHTDKLGNKEKSFVTDIQKNDIKKALGKHSRPNLPEDAKDLEGKASRVAITVRQKLLKAKSKKKKKVLKELDNTLVNYVGKAITNRKLNQVRSRNAYIVNDPDRLGGPDGERAKYHHDEAQAKISKRSKGIKTALRKIANKLPSELPAHRVDEANKLITVDKAVKSVFAAVKRKSALPKLYTLNGSGEVADPYGGSKPTFDFTKHFTSVYKAKKFAEGHHGKSLKWKANATGSHSAKVGNIYKGKQYHISPLEIHESRDSEFRAARDLAIGAGIDPDRSAHMAQKSSPQPGHYLMRGKRKLSGPHSPEEAVKTYKNLGHDSSKGVKIVHVKEASEQKVKDTAKKLILKAKGKLKGQTTANTKPELPTDTGDKTITAPMGDQRME